MLRQFVDTIDRVVGSAQLRGHDCGNDCVGDDRGSSDDNCYHESTFHHGDPTDCRLEEDLRPRRMHVR